MEYVGSFLKSVAEQLEKHRLDFDVPTRQIHTLSSQWKHDSEGRPVAARDEIKGVLAKFKDEKLSKGDRKSIFHAIKEAARREKFSALKKKKLALGFQFKFRGVKHVVHLGLAGNELRFRVDSEGHFGLGSRFRNHVADALFAEIPPHLKQL